jgi:hypothetical protein
LAGTLEADQRVTLYTDCQALVSGIAASQAQVYSHKSKFGGFWEAAQQVVADCHKVPAHLTESQALARGVPKEQWAGNYEADLLAGQALAPVDEVQLAAYVASRKHRLTELRMIGAGLAAWDAMDHPAARLRMVRPGYACGPKLGQGKLGRIPKVRPHMWELHKGTGLHCTV